MDGAVRVVFRRDRESEVAHFDRSCSNIVGVVVEQEYISDGQVSMDHTCGVNAAGAGEELINPFSEASLRKQRTCRSKRLHSRAYLLEYYHAVTVCYCTLDYPKRTRKRSVRCVFSH